MFWQLLGYALVALASYGLARLARRYYQYYRTPLNKLPGPKNSFLMGAFWDIVQRPFMEPSFEWWEEAGKETADFLHYTQLFGSQSVMLLNADHIRQVLLANYRTPRFLKKFVGLEGMYRLYYLLKVQ